jgi:hypothetical protein
MAVGSVDPVAGWITSVHGLKTPGGKLAAPEAIYTWQGESPCSLAWLVYPTPGLPQEKPVITSLPLPGAGPGQVLLRVALAGGAVDYVLIAPGLRGIKKFAGQETEGELAVVHAKTPKSKL